jgi:uncharacterized repeat protein (TIGR02543 family)
MGPPSSICHVGTIVQPDELGLIPDQPTYGLPGYPPEGHPPERDGYTFMGWAFSSAPTEAVHSFVMPESDVVLYAIWVGQFHTITFDANGGEGGKNELLQAGAPLTPPVVTRTGYTFAGWLPFVWEKVPAKDTTYTALWSVNNYAITFDANGGTGGTENHMYFGEAINAPAVSKAGCFFVCWSQTVPATVCAEDANFTALWNLFGDIGNDGQISVTDALMALQAASGFIILTATQLLAADTNHSNSVTIVDALKILQFISGQIISF